MISILPDLDKLDKIAKEQRGNTSNEDSAENNRPAYLLDSSRCVMPYY